MSNKLKKLAKSMMAANPGLSYQGAINALRQLRPSAKSEPMPREVENDQKQHHEPKP